MIKLEDLKTQYTLTKTAHEAVKKQVAIDHMVYLESERNLHEIEGKLLMLRILISKCPENTELRFKGKNGSKHS